MNGPTVEKAQMLESVECHRIDPLLVRGALDMSRSSSTG